MKATKYQVAVMALYLPLANCTTEPGELASCDAGQLHTTMFRITTAAMPRDQFHSVVIGQDFSGDTKSDNWLGAASAGLVGLEPQYDPGAAMARRLQSNVWTIGLSQCTESNAAEATLTHEGVREVAIAVRSGNQFKISGLEMSVPATWLADSSGAALPAGWLATHQAELVVDVDQDTLSGRFAATVDPSKLRTSIVEPLALFLNQPQRGDFLRFAVDADHDGKITTTELANNRAFLELTAPDIADDNASPAWTSVAFDIEATQIQQ
jgi:hypothetical protein